ncbi:MAG: hypothetical protein COX79_02310 [Candidatus Levybacteria bacterium CG_4_10_14_0_2_um_filter_36_16]|nr:MAG: hypothetical protein AUK12_02755 [Candidatus Levybacteria bacterium CG2_30_37_29]PIZ97410.1 MAG: hypothetical protein COX79_02310 [Candidatus Levybacteria bacterium CG_4_10_14_0_2_um_filter_36_16]
MTSTSHGFCQRAVFSWKNLAKIHHFTAYFLLAIEALGRKVFVSERVRGIPRPKDRGRGEITRQVNEQK